MNNQSDDIIEDVINKPVDEIGHNLEDAASEVAHSLEVGLVEKLGEIIENFDKSTEMNQSSKKVDPALKSMDPKEIKEYNKAYTKTHHLEE